MELILSLMYVKKIHQFTKFTKKWFFFSASRRICVVCKESFSSSNSSSSRCSSSYSWSNSTSQCQINPQMMTRLLEMTRNQRSSMPISWSRRTQERNQKWSMSTCREQQIQRMTTMLLSIRNCMHVTYLTCMLKLNDSPTASTLINSFKLLNYLLSWHMALKCCNFDQMNSLEYN